MGVYYCIETVCLILSSLRLNLCVYAVLTIISPTWGMPGSQCWVRLRALLERLKSPEPLLCGMPLTHPEVSGMAIHLPVSWGWLSTEGGWSQPTEQGSGVRGSCLCLLLRPGFNLSLGSMSCPPCHLRSPTCYSNNWGLEPCYSAHTVLGSKPQISSESWGFLR